MDLERFCKTKIVATLGPASESLEMLQALLDAGVNVFRLNMSHLDHHEADTLIGHIRRLTHRAAIMVDLQGPKIRLTDVNEPFDVSPGDTLRLECATEATVPGTLRVPFDELLGHLEVGHRVLIDDGRLRFEVVSCDAGSATLQVTAGGTVKSRKGLAVPDARIVPDVYLDEQDRADARFAAEHRADFVAASYVSRADDVLAVREALGEAGSVIAIVAKIESRMGVNNIDGILQVADGVMVARGDMGVEIPPEEVPLVQKRLIKRCKEVAKPVVVATQMLESMISHPVATRAETSDVANAILDGTDAMMLSAETSVGSFPVEAVKTLVRVSEHVERETGHARADLFQRPSDNVVDFVCKAAARAAEELDIRAIVAFTASGFTARHMSAFEPRVPILATTPSEHVVRHLSLQYGVHAIQAEHIGRYDTMLHRNLEKMVRKDLLRPEDPVAVIGGVPVGTPGSTNMMQVGLVSDLLTHDG